MLRIALRYLKAHPLLAVTALTVTLACGSETTEPGEDPGMTLSLNPTSATVVQGGSTAVTGTLTRTGGFTGAATLTVTGAPAGVTGTVSDETTTGSVTTATVTLDIGAAVALGTHNLTVRAVGSGVTDATAAFALTVTAAPAYTMTLGPAALSIHQGASGTSDVTFARTNFTAGIALTLEDAPAGVTGSFDPTPATGGASVLTVSVDPTVAEGTYPLTVRGTAAGLADRTATLTLTVTVPPPFTLSVEPTALSIIKGQDAQATVTITRNNFTDAVTLALGNAPAGVTGTFDPAAPTGNTSTLTIAVDGSTVAGTYDLTIDGTAVAPIAAADGGSVAADEAAVDQSISLTLTVTEPANYALALNPNALSIQQGASGQTAVAITRTNFTGAVTLSLGNAPANVTGTFDPAAPTGNASTLTVSVGVAVAPGVYDIAVEGTGDAGDKSTPLTLTVTAAPGGFTLSMTPDAVSVEQGNAANATVNINRTGGFSETVNLSVTGAPAGLTATPNPASTGGNTSTLEMNVAGNVVPGSYTLTIHGTATGVPEQTTTVGVTVTPSSGGSSGTIDFSQCDLVDRPVWLAVQDGSGPWTQIVGSGDSYDFTISSAKGGIAWVTDDGAGVSNVAIQYQTKAELTSSTLRFCAPSGGKTVNGTLAGLEAGEIAFVSLGSSLHPAFANGAFSFDGVEDGALDIVGFKRMAGGLGNTDRMFLRRGQNIPNNGSVGTVDFAGAEAFIPASADITVAGLAGGESIVRAMSYLTATGANSCTVSPLYNSDAGGSAVFVAKGAPANQQVQGDFHSIQVIADPGPSGFRSVSESFQTMGDRTVTLGAELPAPAVTTLAGPYKRLQSEVTLPAEYATSAQFGYFDQATSMQSVFIIASFAWLGGTSATLAVPDFSGVTGWDNAWAPASNAATNWFMGAAGGTSQNVCSEGARTVFTQRTGATP